MCHKRIQKDSKGWRLKNYYLFFYLPAFSDTLMVGAEGKIILVC